MKPKPCDCDHCRHRTDSTVCDCGHSLTDHREPFHICDRCLWCDTFRTPNPSRKAIA